jgi:hypothetical protein
MLQAARRISLKSSPPGTAATGTLAGEAMVRAMATMAVKHKLGREKGYRLGDEVWAESLREIEGN